MTYKFTKKAEKAVQIAESTAIKLGHNYVGTEHILYGLVKEGTGIANKVLENQNITADNVLEKIEELIGVGQTKSKLPLWCLFETVINWSDFTVSTLISWFGRMIKSFRSITGR